MNYQNAVPASNAYTEWRIQGVEHCYTYDNIAGMMCEIYRLNYEFLAEVPEEVVLAGGMQISEDGWVVPESPNSQYLVFRRDGDALTFFCSMYENDCMPGDELFTSDLINYCFELGMYDESEGFNPNGEELIRRFKEVDIQTLHAIPFTQDIAGNAAGYSINGDEEAEKRYGRQSCASVNCRSTGSGCMDTMTRPIGVRGLRLRSVMIFSILTGDI